MAFVRVAVVFSKLLHVIHSLLVSLQRRCWEGLLIQKGNDAFLTKHELDDAFTLMLVQLLFFLGTSLASTDRLPSSHVTHTNTKAWLRNVNLLLGLLLVLLALALDFIDSLFQKLFKLCLTLHLLVVLQACNLQEPPLILEHLSKLLDNSLVPLDLLFFRFNLPLGDEDQRAGLLV